MGGSNKSIAQLGAVLVGVVYLAVGVIGFVITGFGDFVQNSSADLLGFDLNPFHNVVHLTIGAYLMFVSRLGKTATEGALIGGGLVYLLAAFLGFDGRLVDLLSINSAGAADNWLHLASGSAALLIGLGSALFTRPERRSDTIQQA